MRKFIFNNNSDISRFLLSDAFSVINQSLDCPVEGCGGHVIVAMQQKHTGSAAICNKCKRAIIVKEVKC